MAAGSFQHQRESTVRCDAVSGVGVATIVAALHLAVLAARVSGRHPQGPVVLLSRQASGAPDAPAAAPHDPPSNPHRNYSVGELALTRGMAVVALARWLHIMRVSGSRTF